MKKCMEYRVEDRRPVVRPRWTWLESVEADMAELEIDREGLHDRKKWRKNVMKWTSRLQTTQPTSDEAVIADTNCCGNCVQTPRSHQCGPNLPFFGGQAGHADPRDGWRCSS